MTLYQHDQDFSIKINGQELMHSRQHESELELARLGCAHLANKKTANVLIGGLGMGYTLRQALDILKPNAKVVVGELLEAVADWNRRFLGELNNHPLQDERVQLQMGDIVPFIIRSRGTFDAILLDIDNGPSAMTDAGNRRLYGRAGMWACRRALRNHGCLAVWSAEPSKPFEQLLMSCTFHVRRYRVPAYKGSKAPSRFVWIASADKTVLPPGGGAPLPPPRKGPHEGPRDSRGRGTRSPRRPS